MKRIKEWLLKNNIIFEENDGVFVIYIQKNCFWVNAYGEKMFYDKKFTIWQNKYNDYMLTEKTDYSMSHKWCQTRHYKKLLEILEKINNKFPKNA